MIMLLILSFRYPCHKIVIIAILFIISNSTSGSSGKSSLSNSISSGSNKSSRDNIHKNVRRYVEYTIHFCCSNLSIFAICHTRPIYVYLFPFSPLYLTPKRYCAVAVSPWSVNFPRGEVAILMNSGSIYRRARVEGSWVVYCFWQRWSGRDMDTPYPAQ